MDNTTLLSVMSFLSKAWSGQVPSISISGVGPCTTLLHGKYSIMMPAPSKFKASSFVIRYRLWRSSLWHESMHVCYGPQISPALVEKHSALKGLIHCIEDYIIDNKGLKLYKGMAKERALSKAYGFSLAMPAKGPVEELCHLILFGTVKGVDKPDDKALAAYKFLRDNYETMDADDLFLKIMSIIGCSKCDSCPTYQFSPETEVAAASKGTFKASQETLSAWAKSVKETEKSVGETGLLDFDESDGEGEPTENDDNCGEGATVEEIARELADTPDEVIHELAAFKADETKKKKYKQSSRLCEVTIKSENTQFYNPALVARLKSTLLKYRNSLAEFSSNRGEFDTEQMFTAKPFIDEELLKVKHLKVSLIMDMSGSVASEAPLYKTATTAIAEALDFIRVPFAIYAFRSNAYRNLLYVVKGIHEKWSKTHVSKIAAIEPGGGTPLYEMLYVLYNTFSKEAGNKVFIIFTDGRPDSYIKTKQMISQMKTIGRVYLIGFCTVLRSDKLKRDLEELHPDGIYIESEMMALPDKVFDLLKSRC